MNYLYLFFLFVLTSCAYPDIDSVPDFKEVKVTEEDSIELCKMSSADNIDLMNCLVTFYELQKESIDK